MNGQEDGERQHLQTALMGQTWLRPLENSVAVSYKTKCAAAI